MFEDSALASPELEPLPELVFVVPPGWTEEDLDDLNEELGGGRTDGAESVPEDEPIDAIVVLRDPPGYIDSESRIQRLESIVHQLAAENRRMAAEHRRMAAENRQLAAEHRRMAAENRQLVSANRRLQTAIGHLASENQRVVGELTARVAILERNHELLLSVVSAQAKVSADTLVNVRKQFGTRSDCAIIMQKADLPEGFSSLTLSPFQKEKRTIALFAA
jgi:predicted RNase H-like nuclease (RuvC/YqgF family)